MTCTKTTVTCTAIDMALKLAGLGQHNRCLIPIPPGPPGAQITVNDTGDGFCWQPTHLPVNLTNLKAPFEWSTADQCGNIPQAPTLVKNPDGSYTFDPGDGSPATLVPKACCPTLVDNGDCTYTFTNGDGTPVTIVPGGRPQSLTALIDNGNGTLTYIDEEGQHTTITLAQSTPTFISYAEATSRGAQFLPPIPTNGLPVASLLALTTLVKDNLNGAQDNLPTGLRATTTQRYDLQFSLMLTSTEPSQLFAVEAYACSRLLAQWQYETFAKTNAAGTRLVRDDLLSVLINAGETVHLWISWYGASTPNVSNYSLKLRGTLLTT